MLDRLGEVLATTGPVHPSDAHLRRVQSLAEDSGAAMRIAVELIRRKLLAQERLVREQLEDTTSAEIIASQRHALARANSKEDIRRYEAYGALAYWRAWHNLPIQFSQSDLQRVPKHWQVFGSRVSPLTKSPRLAVNPPNAMLNYLYAILESEARLAIAEVGLDPGIGVLHSDTRTGAGTSLRARRDFFYSNFLRTRTHTPTHRRTAHDSFIASAEPSSRSRNQCALRVTTRPLSSRPTGALFAHQVHQSIGPW